MRFSAFCFTFLTLAIADSVLSAPSSLKVVEGSGREVSGRHIIKFKKGIATKSWIKRLKQGKNAARLDIINGISLELNTDELNELRASADVESIADDPIMHAFGTQTNATWGLQRITQTGPLSNQNAAGTSFAYTYNDAAGAGVDVYVVDTGILTTHKEFGGRAKWGVSYVGSSTDGNGHGTHCAGIIGSVTYGVSKKVNLITVQVLSASGSGATSGIISGLNWVASQAKASRRPSIVSMSLGGSASPSLDSAIATLTSAGIHVVVAAGNDGVNAQDTSPARAPSAITVGATTINDERASFSNYGSVIDIFAPGTGITSTWIGSSNNAINSISGTSMAAPHVAGAVAYLISKDGNINPAAMATKLQSLATKNALSNVPSGTVNYLLHI